LGVGALRGSHNSFLEAEMKDLKTDLLAMRIKLEVHKKKASTFGEEVVIGAVIHSVGEALDILNGKRDLLQGLNGEQHD